MQTLELVKILPTGNLIVRTKDKKLADDYWIGKMFLDYDGKTWYCWLHWEKDDGYYYMRMVTHD